MALLNLVAVNNGRIVYELDADIGYLHFVEGYDCVYVIVQRDAW